MSDNDIIKALECCRVEKGSYSCKKCPLFCRIPACQSHLAEAALDLINRQKAEIERLLKDCADIDNFARDICKERMLKGKTVADFEDLQEYIKKKRAEAIKEFAERLKAIYGEWLYDYKIDDLVKEMMEEQE